MDNFEITNPMKMPFEKILFNTIRDHPDQFHLAPEDGDFDEFDTLFRNRNAIGKRSILRIIGKGNSKLNRLRIAKAMLRNSPGIFSAKYRMIKDIKPVLIRIKSGDFQQKADNVRHNGFPNDETWEELKEFAYRKHGITSIGFTKVPTEFIFRDRGILYRHAVVFCQEEDKEEIDKAPDIAAGAEVQRIYNSLGKASLDISRWLSSRGHSVQGDHPSGGLVNFVPLAAKAGLGSIGHNGLLITPQYGQRVRIAAIYLEEQMFRYTDSNEHDWIQNYCDLCTKCVRKCPTNAIYEKRRPLRDDVEGFGQMKTCIDNEKCAPYFFKTLGCNICVKVCPFSESKGMYVRLHKVWTKREERLRNKNLIELN